MSESVKGQLAGPGLHDRLCRIEERLAKLEEIIQAIRADRAAHEEKMQAAAKERRE